MSTDRVLQINGDLNKVVEAIRAVITLLHEVRAPIVVMTTARSPTDTHDVGSFQIPLKGANKPYDTINYDPGFVQDYGGYPPDRNWRGGPPPRGG